MGFEKKCARCGKLKGLEEFHRRRTSPDGFQAYCKGCNIRQATDANWRNMGMDLNEESYRDLLEAQNHRCAICRRGLAETTRALAADHDHTTGRVRGLLCLDCNTGLGKFRDDPALLRNAAAYIEKHSHSG